VVCGKNYVVKPLDFDVKQSFLIFITIFWDYCSCIDVAHYWRKL